MDKDHANESLRKNITEAISFLKKTKITVKAKAKKLNQAPWFLLIGAKNSGKSTLLHTSDLKFNLEPKSFHQHKHPHWWVNANAVYVDLPGAYTDPDNKDKAKLALKLIKKNAPQKTIQAVILVVSIKDMLRMKEEEQAAYLDNITSQLQQFKPKQPVFVVFNKLDLLSGFNAFFDDFSLDERQQPWGFNLSNTSGVKLLDKITTEFDRLVQRLNQQLIWRLHHEPSLQKRTLIKDFPAQFAGIKVSLLRFFTELLSRSKNNAYLGIYFTAARIGQPNAGNITSDKALAVIGQQAEKSYFSQSLFRKRFFDAIPIQAGSSITSKPWFFNSLIASVIVVVGLATIALSVSFSRQEHRYQALNQSLVTLQTNLNQGNTNNVQASLPLFNTLNQINQTLKHAGAMSSVLGSRHKLNHDTKMLYVHAVTSRLIPVVQKTLENSLQNAENLNPALLYRILSSYLMLEQANHFDPDYFNQTLHTLWQQSSMSNPQMINALLTKLDKAIVKIKPQITLNYNLVLLARNTLKSLKPIDMAQAVLISDLSPAQSVSINIANNAAANRLFILQNKQQGIPVCYTAPSLNKLKPASYLNAASAVINGNWVLGGGLNKPLAIDQLSLGLKQHYITNYANAWLHFLSNISIRPTNDLQTLKETLASVSSNHSELFQLIQLVHDNTNEQLLNNPSLNAFYQVTSNTSIEDSLLSILTNLNQYIQDQSTPEALLKTTALRMQNQGANDPISALLNLSDRFPEPLKSWLQTLANNAWQTLLDNASLQISRTWQHSLYVQFQNQFESNYPFNLQANQTVNLDNFAAFYGPGGNLLQFYTTDLRPFLNTDTAIWTAKTLDGQGLALTTDAIHFFQTLNTDNLSRFPAGTQTLFSPFTLTVNALSTNLSDVILTLGNKTAHLNLTNSTSPVTFRWPATQNNADNKITFVDRHQHKTELKFSGPWGVWKLFKRAHLTQNAKTGDWTGTLQDKQNALKFNVRFADEKNPFNLAQFKALTPPSVLLISNTN
jgi:type VI secretion system protein ImpL